MSYTASALKILSHRYRLVLLKCALLNAGLLLAAAPASAGTLDGLKQEIAFPTGTPYQVGNIETNETLGTLGSNGGARIVRLQNGTITASGGFGGIIVPDGTRSLSVDNVTFSGFTGYDIQNDNTDYLFLIDATLNTGVTGTGTMVVKGETTVASIEQSSIYMDIGTLNISQNLTPPPLYQ